MDALDFNGNKNVSDPYRMDRGVSEMSVDNLKFRDFDALSFNGMKNDGNALSNPNDAGIKAFGSPSQFRNIEDEDDGKPCTWWEKTFQGCKDTVEEDDLLTQLEDEDDGKPCTWWEKTFQGCKDSTNTGSGTSGNTGSGTSGNSGGFWGSGGAGGILSGLGDLLGSFNKPVQTDYTYGDDDDDKKSNSGTLILVSAITIIFVVVVVIAVKKKNKDKKK